MPTTLPPHGIKVPSSDLEPPAVSGIIDLGTSVNAALTRPYVHLEASAVTSIANSSTGTKINLANTVHVDSDHFGVGSSEVTILQDGLYRVSARANGTATGTTGSREAMVGKNGLTEFVVNSFVASQTQYSCTLEADMVPLLEGDTLALYYAQVSGSARNTVYTAGFYVDRLVVVKVG